MEMDGRRGAYPLGSMPLAKRDEPIFSYFISAVMDGTGKGTRSELEYRF